LFIYLLFFENVNAQATTDAEANAIKMFEAEQAALQKVRAFRQI
jgi:hypothetical protein